MTGVQTCALPISASAQVSSTHVTVKPFLMALIALSADVVFVIALDGSCRQAAAKKSEAIISLTDRHHRHVSRGVG